MFSQTDLCKFKPNIWMNIYLLKLNKISMKIFRTAKAIQNLCKNYPKAIQKLFVLDNFCSKFSSIFAREPQKDVHKRS